MGELQTEPFQFTFNGYLKAAFQGSRVTSDAGLILVRELDERLGLEAIIAELPPRIEHAVPVARSPAAVVYSRLAGYEDLNDAQRLSADPHVPPDRLADGWDRSAALTSTLHCARAADP